MSTTSDGKFIRQEGWGKGTNNRARINRLPDGAVRSAINVDVTSEGTFLVRAGYSRIYEGTKVYNHLSAGDKLLVSDNGFLVELDPTTGATRTLRAIGHGPLCGAVFNDELYFCTASETLRYRDGEVRDWGVQDSLNSAVPTVGTGGLTAGLYSVATTFVNADGVEGGTDLPVQIEVPEGSSLTVSLPEPPPGGLTRLYVSPAGASTLYAQQDASSAQFVTVSLVRSDTARLDTQGYRKPPVGTRMAVVNGVILIAAGRVLWATLPLRPHHVKRTSGWVQFPVNIGEVMVDGGTAFVSADKAYAITGLDGGEPQQRVAHEVPAFPGTAVELPDGRVAWMTMYGQAVSEGGNLRLINERDYVVGTALGGAAGVIERSGSRHVVTNVKKPRGSDGIAASSHFYGEVKRK